MPITWSAEHERVESVIGAPEHGGRTVHMGDEYFTKFVHLETAPPSRL
jgi:hypothetical protein